jgi:hypothetical protein
MTRIEFIEFLNEFKTDLENNKIERRNKTLGDFLESFEAYTEDGQGYYDNSKFILDADESTWENFKTILKGASMYE